MDWGQKGDERREGNQRRGGDEGKDECYISAFYFVYLFSSFLVCRDAGIPEMLDVDDMLLVKIPDSKSIMTFLVTIYQHFNS